MILGLERTAFCTSPICIRSIFRSGTSRACPARGARRRSIARRCRSRPHQRPRDVGTRQRDVIDLAAPQAVEHGRTRVHRIDLAIDRDLLDAPRGGEGKPTLFRCSGCGRGYVEVTVQFKAVWKKKDDKDELEESWLAASLALDTHEMERFRPHFEKA